MLEFDMHAEESQSQIEGQCYACDGFAPVDDLSMYEEWWAKLERDLIRQRDWDYSVAAFGLSDEGREGLRHRVVG